MSSAVLQKKSDLMILVGRIESQQSILLNTRNLVTSIANAMRDTPADANIVAVFSFFSVMTCD